MNMAKESSTLFRVRFTTLCNIVAGLMSIAIVFCVSWSVVFNFKESTATHCRVKVLFLVIIIQGYNKKVFKKLSLRIYAQFDICIVYNSLHVFYLISNLTSS